MMSEGLQVAVWTRWLLDWRCTVVLNVVSNHASKAAFGVDSRVYTAGLYGSPKLQAPKDNNAPCMHLCK